MADDILSAARRMVLEAGALRCVALRLRDLYGWRCRDETAVARLSQMLSRHDRHRLPAEALEVIIEETGLDYITPLLQHRRALAEMRAALAERERMPAVRVGRRRAERDTGT